MPRSGTNLTLAGGGLHHVALGVRDLDASVRFYREALGCREVLRFPEGERTVAMLDTGDGSYLELFSGGREEGGGGVLLHLALRTGDCDAAVERARAAGARIPEEPTTMALEGDPPVPVRYAFVEGPDGERIELLQSDRI